MSDIFYADKGVRVYPRSIAKIASLAGLFRLQNNEFVDKNGRIDMYRVLEKHALYNVLEDDLLPSNIEACSSQDGTILISETTFNNLCDGQHRARFTIAHEFGHIMLNHFSEISLNRGSEGEIKTFCNSEWQANEFAGWLLVDPLDLKTNAALPIPLLSMKYGASNECIERRLSKLDKVL
ncbi:protein of unknown function [Succinivibrio dextrinosolvens DSM 3072]|uniref:IrrE N-terminal-like domain-containing protein n=1 Tax=Succinivibrio dextrinosolvens DSM 3072 TaxID=1123324 RepID=A0A1T4VF45_9GAMM|nr:ImmA/IrrE family metallo-endopeptidase [Succinivibrio dextrinosolvens]SKA63547.1 protein of unknown function [Succinivibrio dextrinosolvens DSM 3072]